MSTPTTATATIPHSSHYQHHPPHHYPYYSTNPSTAYAHRATANQLLPSTTRLAPSYPPSTSTSSYAPSSSTQSSNTSSTTLNGSSFSSNSSLARSQRQHDLVDLPNLLDSNYTTMAAPVGSSKPLTSPSSNAHIGQKRRRDSPVDWKKFYGGHPPKEIIVIDDTPEPESAAVSAVSASHTLTHPSSASSNTTYTYTNGASVGANTSAARHAPKRRKRDDNIPTTSGTRYDPVHHSRMNDTATPRRNANATPSASTISSSDRTNSAIHTTAATSLGSLSSNGQYEHDAQPGQKRKRTRQQVANEVKRRETAITGHNYPSYHPPPNPPKKAGEVSVRVITDVSSIPQLRASI